MHHSWNSNCRIALRTKEGALYETFLKSSCSDMFPSFRFDSAFVCSIEQHRYWNGKQYRDSNRYRNQRGQSLGYQRGHDQYRLEKCQSQSSQKFETLRGKRGFFETGRSHGLRSANHKRSRPAHEQGAKAAKPTIKTSHHPSLRRGMPFPFPTLLF